LPYGLLKGFLQAGSYYETERIDQADQFFKGASIIEDIGYQFE